MRWLKEHGVIGCYDDYVALPLPILEDAKVFMEAEGAAYRRQRAKEEAAEARRGRQPR